MELDAQFSQTPQSPNELSKGIQTSSGVLDNLSTLAGKSYPTTSQAVDDILKLIANQLGMRSSYLSQIDRSRDNLVVQFAYNDIGGCGVMSGSEHDVQDTY